MAKFIADGFLDDADLVFDTNRGVVLMNAKGNVNFRFRLARIKVYSDKGDLISEHVSKRGVITAPDGAQVLPYFRCGGKWHVVMIDQFRIAVSSQTIECPGGEVDLNDVQAVMAKELREEAKINVDPRRIKVVFCELIQPSTMNAWAYGGIVKLEPAEVQNQAIGGEWQFGEFTAVAAKPLIEMLRLRDSGKHNLDLWGSRLLDEVAKEVGLLKKCY